MKVSIIILDTVPSFISKLRSIEGEYKTEVKYGFDDSLSRQVEEEGVLIRRCEKNVLNTKAEWQHPALWSVQSALSRE